MPTRVRLYGLIALVAVAAAACASAEAADRPVVSIDNGVYTPSVVRVPVGATVSWQNNDAHAYTVTSMVGAPEAFDSGEIQAGNVYTRTFDRPGQYFYEDRGRADAQTYGEVIVGGRS
jgi:plastocyanin